MEPEKPSRLVDNWRFVLLRSWSTRFVAAVTAVGALALGNLDVLAAVLSMAPPEVRAFVPLPVMFLVFGAYLLARIWKQKK